MKADKPQAESDKTDKSPPALERVGGHTLNGQRRPLGTALRDLDPGYFSVVMATGIVALAAHFTGLPVVARVLSIIDIVAYTVLVVLMLARFASNGRRASRQEQPPCPVIFLEKLFTPPPGPLR